MKALIWTANLFGWPLIHIVIASLALRLPSDLFARDTWLTAPRRWERGGQVYRDWLAIRRWKARLPDGARWIGSPARKKLLGTGSAQLALFQLETRRAELAHWVMLCCLPIFFLWNPAWARWVMTAYALAANLPCIVAQRYNRITLDRVVQFRKRPLLTP
jgi:glycosyl-4,4'-diaponeurosporenoate acyltransferase